jgi:hypothetical protein
VKNKIILLKIPEQDQTPLVKSLLGIIEQLAERVQRQDEEIAQLKDDVNILKGEKKHPMKKLLTSLVLKVIETLSFRIYTLVCIPCDIGWNIGLYQKTNH